MEYFIYDCLEKLGDEASQRGADAMRRAIAKCGAVNIVLATGRSQLATLNSLISRNHIDWSVVTAFHLDEYIGLAESHPASFRRYLQERFVSKIKSLAGFHFVNGNALDPHAECRRLNKLFEKHPIDVSFIGIGENAHLAFNDPPADFDIDNPYTVVDLSVSCRQQQVYEGWFKRIEDVPRCAITMTIKQIMKSSSLVISVPERRKAKAVKCTVEGPVTNDCPASIVQMHGDCYLYLDEESASLLSSKSNPQAEFHGHARG